ncbi:hypothetical protein KAW65_03480 [candidate division WOR-3 bacterium]|nr:hypothetical protein [candidate division WOR-3 bacterium]
MRYCLSIVRSYVIGSIPGAVISRIKLFRGKKSVEEGIVFFNDNLTVPAISAILM